MKKLFGRKRIDSSMEHARAAEYASAEEFCAIFRRNLSSLYTLALALTGSHAKAEQCLMAALDQCRRVSVFKAWANSWSRLAVIESAIKLVGVGDRAASEAEQAERDAGLHPDAAPIYKLSNLERFAFVLTVLDHYSVGDCAILLRCSRKEVEAAKIRALQHMATDAHAMLNAEPLALQTPA